MHLLNTFRSSYKIDGRVYRVFPSGEVQYLHPKVRTAPRQPSQSGHRRRASRGRPRRRTRAFEYSLGTDIWSCRRTEQSGCCFLCAGAWSIDAGAAWSCFRGASASEQINNCPREQLGRGNGALTTAPTVPSRLLCRTACTRRR